MIYPASWNFNRFTSSSFSVVSGSALCLTQYSADINMHILLTILYIFLMVLIGKSWLNNHSILCRIITLILLTIASINWSARVEAETYLSWELRTNMANIQSLNTHLTHSYHRSLQNWKCTLFFHNNWHKVKMDTCHYKGLKGSNRKVSLWGIKNKHGWNPIACWINIHVHRDVAWDFEGVRRKGRNVVVPKAAQPRGVFLLRK